MFKKFLIIGGIIFIAIFICLIASTVKNRKNNSSFQISESAKYTSDKKQSNKSQSKSSQEISSQDTLSPISNKTIVVDAGHGSPDEGAVGQNGITEATLNLQIAKKLETLLKNSSCNVIMTRSDENGIQDEDAKNIRQMKVSDLKNRAKIGNSSSADIFVSIHLNKISDSKYYGWQTFYKEGDDNSKRLATNIQNSLNNTISIENKRTPLKLSGIYLMKNIEIPIALVECGFLSNENESAKLITDSYQEQLAWGIYNGIVEYFSY